jgi:hypothetical protein
MTSTPPSNPHIQDSEWFTDMPQDNTDVARFWKKFEIELHRAITTIESHGHHPVIRVSERMFALAFTGRYTKVMAACWSVYMFRGYPIALRENFSGWDVVEVLDEQGNTACTFKI